MAGTYTFSSTPGTTLDIPVPRNAVQFCCHITLVNNNIDEILFQGTNNGTNFFSLDAFQRNDAEDHVSDYAMITGEYYIHVGATQTLRFTPIKEGASSGNITVVGFFSESSSSSKSVASTLGKASYIPQGKEINDPAGSVLPLRMGPDGGLIVTGQEFDFMREVLSDIRRQLKINNMQLSLMTGTVIDPNDLNSRDEEI